MQKLWGRFWFRALVSLIAAPPLLLASTLAAMSVVQVIFDGGAPAIPPPEAVPFLLIGAAVMSLPLWIAMEVMNRRWLRPFPPGLSAGYVAAFGSVFILVLYTLSRVDLLDDVANAGTFAPIMMLGGCYLAAAAVTTALASPVIQRWKKRTATPAELSGLF